MVAEGRTQKETLQSGLSNEQDCVLLDRELDLELNEPSIGQWLQVSTEAL